MTSYERYSVSVVPSVCCLLFGVSTTPELEHGNYSEQEKRDMSRGKPIFAGYPGWELESVRFAKGFRVGYKMFFLPLAAGGGGRMKTNRRKSLKIFVFIVWFPP